MHYAQSLKLRTDWLVLSFRWVSLLVSCFLFICSWMVLSVWVYMPLRERERERERVRERERERERERGQWGPHCSNISKFADVPSAWQAWDSSGPRISHTDMQHSQTAWHSIHRHTYCTTHIHTHSIIQFRRGAQSHVAVTWPAPGLLWQLSYLPVHVCHM